ncbi:MAG: methyl-accepting chemotaxis protein [Tepidibacter sp.]|jgi:methyl-accepting chemotaxis protein|uniref:methyl-accepting chemotaxis protein n=1 Tax=Tepidibacter sp. TaxID=2529387 RepID=UPI0025DE8A07|nr:methyl-accepting chemotaxis protein [Tepidibacter sp.]MCT4507886.1 methyl-accepting chemotaxis protein [Tepidibacter sp.]
MKKILKFRNNSISFKIIATALIVFLTTISILAGVSLNTMKKEMIKETEKMGMELVKEMVNEIETSNIALSKVEFLLEDKIKTVGKIIAQNPNLCNQFLVKISETTGVSEINIADSKGITIYSNFEEYVGTGYSENNPVQYILRDEKKEVFEEIRKSEDSDDYYKYGAIALENGGFVQVGIIGNKIQELKSSMDIQNKVEKIGQKESIIFALVIDKNLKAVAHSNTDSIGKQLDDKGSKTAAVEGKPYASKYPYQGQEVYDVLVPLYEDGIHIGAVDIGLSMKQINNALKILLIKTIIISIISFIVGGIILSLLIRKVTNPLKKLVEVANKVSNGDLTQDIDIKSKDEVGMLADSFNKMINNLRDITSKIQDVGLNVASYSQELFSAAEQASTVSEQIAISTQDIADGAEQQVKSTMLVLNNIKEVADSIEKINDEIYDVVDNADNTSKLASDGREKMNSMIKQMNTIKYSVNYTSGIMNEFEKTSDEIGNIVQVINNIADQTNLLSLNAAIEAARAGESGRGFAVVADEIRKLAEETIKSSDNIKKLINKTQENAKKAIVSIEGGNKEAEKGEVVVEEVGIYLNEIIQGFDLTKNKLDIANKNILEVNTNTENIVNLVDEIESISEESAANTEEVAASSEEQSATIEEITKSVEELANMSRELEEVIQVFKL